MVDDIVFDAVPAQAESGTTVHGHPMAWTLDGDAFSAAAPADVPSPQFNQPL